MKCSKKKYDNIGAKLALEEIKKSTNWKRMECRAYFCMKCKAFHLTSKPRY